MDDEKTRQTLVWGLGIYTKTGENAMVRTTADERKEEIEKSRCGRSRWVDPYEKGSLGSADIPFGQLCQIETPHATMDAVYLGGCVFQDRSRCQWYVTNSTDNVFRVLRYRHMTPEAGPQPKEDVDDLKGQNVRMVARLASLEEKLHAIVMRVPENRGRTIVRTPGAEPEDRVNWDATFVQTFSNVVDALKTSTGNEWMYTGAVSDSIRMLAPDSKLLDDEGNVVPGKLCVMLRRCVEQTVEKIQGMSDDLEASRRSHGKICQHIKRLLGLRNWPYFGEDSNFVDGVLGLLDKYIERLEKDAGFANLFTQRPDVVDTKYTVPAGCVAPIDVTTFPSLKVSDESKPCGAGTCCNQQGVTEWKVSIN